jgi:site-specific DNA recombinase
VNNTTGDGSKRALLYARVSTEEQVRSGYSLAQQLEALRDYAARGGYEIQEEVADPAQSGASLERPGMDRVRDLVACGGISVVLAQDRDRFAREPAYHYQLKREFEDHDCRLKALNDHGDDSPEGELTDGILDQLAKYERAKTAERTRRGKLRKASQGKLIAGRRPNYGFRYNRARDGYEVDENTMPVIERIFRMAAMEGTSVHGIKRVLDAEGVPTPSGRKYWHWRAIHSFIMDDVYRSHPFDEVAELVTSEVDAGLDPSVCYGIWWYNRQRVQRSQVSEVGPAGRTYRRRGKYSMKDRSEWIAVPVPDSGIPREVVEAARRTALSYRDVSKAGGCARWSRSARAYQATRSSSTWMPAARCATSRPGS